ncbi:MAG: AI-2E family transporter [Pedosphaera sp.]|nr:AI-2E family transporter [Pedosphaera sp.]
MLSNNSKALDPERISYAFIVLMLVLVGWLKMAIPLITVLFCHFALRRLSFGYRKWLGLLLFSLLFGGLIYGAIVFAKRVHLTLPEIASESIPVVLGYAEKQGFELPFTDYASLKDLLLGMVKEQIKGVGRYAGSTLVELVSFVIGVVVALSLFLNSQLEIAGDSSGQAANLYTATFRQIVARFRTFYQSFATVMGAQILISMINTSFTSAFLIWNNFPYTTVIIGLTFLFGLLPILGNLMSNALIVCVAFTLSPKMAFTSLVFLVIIHKLEYFLNSKIIGQRIKNPMWLTLLGLVIGEKLMGLPGMILAPVILHYIKVEASRSPLAKATALSEAS